MIGGSVSLLLTFVPAWADAVPFAWPAGIIVSGLTYAFLSLRAPQSPDSRARAIRPEPPAEAPVEAR